MLKIPTAGQVVNVDLILGLMDTVSEGGMSKKMAPGRSEETYRVCNTFQDHTLVAGFVNAEIRC